MEPNGCQMPLYNMSRYESAYCAGFLKKVLSLIPNNLFVCITHEINKILLSASLASFFPYSYCCSKCRVVLFGCVFISF